MTLTELLDSDLVLPKTPCASKDELISKMVDRIYSINKDFPIPQEEILKAIYLREKIGGTLLPSGLSVPHARQKEYEKDFIIALATPMQPIFHEGIQVRLMALMISNKTGGPHYLPTVTALTKISMDAEYLSRLCDAETPEDFIFILEEKDHELA